MEYFFCFEIICKMVPIFCFTRPQENGLFKQGLIKWCVQTKDWTRILKLCFREKMELFSAWFKRRCIRRRSRLISAPR